jgi:hypothetical protein
MKDNLLLASDSKDTTGIRHNRHYTKAPQPIDQGEGFPEEQEKFN